MLKLDRVAVRYGDAVAVRETSLEVAAGQWWMLAGPNGAGKSSLAGAVAQGVPYTGKMELLGRDIRAYRPGELARRVGMLSQNHFAGYAFSVEEVVSLGRYAHSRGVFHRGDESGREKIEEALEMTGLTALRRRSIVTLSGGELQRVFLSQVLAQDPALLILDEPANHLDLPYQKQLFSLIGQWLLRPGRAVISVVHDLSLAKRYGTHALLLRAGEPVAQGRAAEVLAEENLRRVYGMDVAAWMRELLSQWQ